MNALDPTQAFKEAIASPLSVQAVKPRVALKALDLGALASHKFKERLPLLDPIIKTQDLAMVFAPRGVGKTHFAIAVAMAVAFGGVFGPWRAPKPAKVLYLDGELPGEVFKSRLVLHLPESSVEPSNFRVFTPDFLGMDDHCPTYRLKRGRKLLKPLSSPTPP